uniref:Extended synaptotagmin 2 n=1 Tax=Fundulus heteroclitus TaxID=8078 RepID=A0A3Q2PL34_FUNHE
MTAVRGGAHSNNASPATPKENGHATQPASNFPHPSPVSAPHDDSPLRSSSELTHTWVHFVKTFVIIFPIYALGYFEFSFSWLLIGLFIFFCWRRNAGEKLSRLSRALAFFDQEEERSAQQRLTTSDLPPWVRRHKPLINDRVAFTRKRVRNSCEPNVLKSYITPAVHMLKPHLTIFLCKTPLRINGVKVYTENVDRRQIVMDLQISFVGNTEIDVDIKRYYCKAGIKSIQIHGVLRVVMEPLLGDVPLVGGLSLFFLKKPLLDINWTVLSNFGFSNNVIQDIIYSYLVLPNRITIPLVGEEDLAKLRFPMPKGVLRIHFLEAQDLEGKDQFLGGLIKGKSDPYGILHVSNQMFHSKTIKESLHPKWNEVYEALVYEPTAALICLPCCWFELEEAPTGKLHLKLEWLSLFSTPEKLDQVLRCVRADRSPTRDGLSSALLVVFLDSAKNLPSAKKNSSEPSPYVQFTVGQKTLESKVRYKTREPLWEDCFPFLIHNPTRQDLEVEVKDDKHKCTLGVLRVPLSRLLSEEDMTLAQCFPLKNSGPSSSIKLKMALRILSLEKQISSDLPSAVQVRKSSVSQTAPAPSLTLSASESQLLSATPSKPVRASTLTLQDPDGEPYSASPRRSAPNLSTGMSGSQKYLPHKESTPSLASDISLPIATLELQQRLHHLQNGSGPGQYPLGEIQLTVRHSSQRNKLVVVVYCSANLIAFTKDGSDPFIRLYLLPDKSRSGRRKTSTMKKTLNPVYDQTFDFPLRIMSKDRPCDKAVKHANRLVRVCRALCKRQDGAYLYVKTRLCFGFFHGIMFP